MALAPIILFVYNRPWHTRQTVEALQKCELAAESDLYIFADGSKEDASEETLQKIAEVRQFIQTIDGFKSIHIQESPANKGLANSVIQGVSEVINKHGKVIVVEDDIVAHPFFLRFMNEALVFYEKDNRIFSIGAWEGSVCFPRTFKHDVYVCPRIESWGWGTWKNRWQTANWNIKTYPIVKNPTKKRIKELNKSGIGLWELLEDQINGTIDSWAIRWQYNLTIQNKLCLRPVTNLVINIGFDGTGTHCGANYVLSDNKYTIEQLARLFNRPIYSNAFYNIKLVKGIKENYVLNRRIRNYYSEKKQMRISRLIKKVFKHCIEFYHRYSHISSNTKTV